MRNRVLLRALSCAVLILFGCESESTGSPVTNATANSQALISDGAHSAGTTGFYFLSPMVPAPNYTGAFVELALGDPAVYLMLPTSVIDRAVLERLPAAR